MDAHALHAFGVIAAALQCAHQLRGNVRARRQFGHAMQVGHAEHRHDACADRHADAREVAALAPIQERVVVEEQLRADPVRAGVHLGLQVIHQPQRVGRFGMTLGKRRHADAEAARVGVSAAFIEGPDESHQVGGVRKVSGLRRAAARRIATQRKDVRHALRCVALQNCLHLGPGVTHAGQVRHWIERGLAAQSQHQFARALARASAGAVGDADEAGGQALQGGDRCEELLPSRILLRRKELEACGARIARKDVRHVHG